MALSPLNWKEAFLLALSDTLVNILSYIPKILASIAIFLIGLILARWLKEIVIKILRGLKLSNLVKKTGIEPFLKKAEIKLKIEEVIAGFIEWLTILVFFIATINLLGLSTVSLVLNSILAYIPKVIAAVLILTIGVLLSGLVESLIKGALGQIDIKASRVFAKISSYLVFVFALLAAINELKIAQNLINTLIIGFVAMLALGLALALGLGAKDLVARILEEWYENFKKEIKK